MLLITNLLFLLVSFSGLNRSFSAVFLVPNYESVVKDYDAGREASPYRGLLFSYSTAKKKQLCLDIFSPQLYVVPEPTPAATPSEAATPHAEGLDVAGQEQEKWMDIGLESVTSDTRFDRYITDGLNTDGGPQFPVIVRALGLYTEEDKYEERPEIHFKCIGQNFVRTNFYSHLEFYVSTAFRPGWWHGSTPLLGDENKSNHELMRYYVNSSAEHVPLKQEELEEQYVTTRQIIDQLRVESPAYVHLIETRELLTLPKWQQRYLCASILSSPIYRDDRLEYSLEWVTNENNPAVEDKYLAFKIEKYEDALENPTSRCIICRGFENVAYEDLSTNLYLIGSYDNKESLYVLKEEYIGISFSKYFRKSPVLVNARENIEEVNLVLNY